MLPSEVAHLSGSAGYSQLTASGATSSPSIAALDVKWLELQKQVSCSRLNSSV